MFRIKYMHHKKNLSVLKEICVLKIVYLLAIHHSCQCRNGIQQSRCCKSLRGTNQKNIYLTVRCSPDWANRLLPSPLLFMIALLGHSVCEILFRTLGLAALFGRDMSRACSIEPRIMGIYVSVRGNHSQTGQFIIFTTISSKGPCD